MSNITQDVQLIANRTILILSKTEEQIRIETEQQFWTNCVAFAAITILVWDHIITFVDEVKHVWKGGAGPVKWLFLLNRYLTPLGFTVNIFAYLSPVLSDPSKCRNFVKFEGSMTVIGINVVALMMFFRVYALYGTRRASRSDRFFLALLGTTFLLEVAINAWLLSKGVPVPHLPGTKGCEMIFDSSVRRPLASSSAWLPLVYDTMVLVMIMCKTVPQSKGSPLGPLSIHKQMLEDGLLYYVPILLVTLVLSLMIAFAKDGSQNIAAQLELIITVTMMSRITFNLKKRASRARPNDSDIDVQLAAMPTPARAAVEQVASVLNITRSAVQNDRNDDIELTPRNFNSDSTDDGEDDFSSSDYWYKSSVA